MYVVVVFDQACGVIGSHFQFMNATKNITNNNVLNAPKTCRVVIWIAKHHMFDYNFRSKSFFLIR